MTKSQSNGTLEKNDALEKDNKEIATEIVLKTSSHSGVEGVELYYEEDGVYICYDKNKLEEAVSEKDMPSYIKRKGLSGVKATLLDEIIAEGVVKNRKIAPQQEEKILDAFVDVKCTNANMEAWMTIYPADVGGAVFDIASLMNKIMNDYGISNKMDMDAVQKALKSSDYFKKIQIATGKPPVDGENGKLIYHFELNDQKDNANAETGKIDFRELTEFFKVEKGQVLYTRTAPTQGESGYDVTGRELAPKPGREAVLQPAKNIVLGPDKNSLISAINGRLEREKERYVVSPSVKIKGDVDMTVGNIDFAGDIEISGCVNAGFAIKASGSIVVHGIVESSSLYAGGDITLKSGVSGADKAVIVSGGSIFVKFVERASLEAAKSIVTEFSLHSTLMCEDFIDVSLGKGAIIGGNTISGNYIVAKIIGADADTITNIEIGVSPKTRARYREVEETLKTLTSALGRLELTLDAASKQNGGKFSPKTTLELKSKLARMLGLKEQLLIEQTQIDEIIKNVSDGHIHVSDKVHRGTKLSIGKSVLQIKQDDQYVTYLREKKEIVAQSFSYVKGSKKS